MRTKFFLRILEDETFENWLSFLSGIFANIPVGLLFAFQNPGNSILEYIFFGVYLLVFVLSLLLVGFSFSFTIGIINAHKDIREEVHRMEKENNRIDDGFIAEAKAKIYETNNERKNLHTKFKFVLLFLTLLVVGALALWGLHIAINYCVIQP